ncbi:MAG: DNA polymerase IV [Bacteroidales bacterium]|nr:DNA polymerase IV [Bacteroidales bacterium]
MKSRSIVHMDLDSFFVSVERLKNSRLNGIPVVVGGGSDRGVVSACSYESRVFGVRSGMPTKMARYLCPDAVFIRGDMDLYARYSKIVTDIIAEKAPVYEKASIDEHYLDITGMDKFYGSYKWTHELKESIVKNTGLPISFGLSVNKTVAKIATGEGKPFGEKCVEQPMVNQFLDPLSIKKIPMLGKKTYSILRAMGVSDIKTIRQIPPVMIENLLGKNGKSLWEKANGIDNTPVFSYSERKSIGSETTFEKDTIDINKISDIISGMAVKLSYQLRKEQWLTSCVVVKIRYSDFDTHTLQKAIPYTAFDHVLVPAVKELFAKLYQRRVLIRLVGIRFTKLIRSVPQLDLFEDTPEMIRLYMSLDNIRKKYGERIIRKGNSWYR